MPITRCRFRPSPHPPSSNRTFVFPAYGAPTGFHRGGTRNKAPTASVICAAPLLSSPLDTAFSEGPGIIVGVLQAIRQSPFLAIFESTPELRAKPPELAGPGAW